MESAVKLKKEKGFTLIELMIVLAIIAILAIVLIPKSQIFKNNSKNAGVTTNVNTVRGYLESQVTNNGGVDSYLSAKDLTTKMVANFNLKSSGSNLTPNNPANENEQIVNPFGKDKVSVRVVNKTTGKMSNTISADKDTNHDGAVVIYVYKDGYAVFGYDKGGSASDILKIK